MTGCPVCGGSSAVYLPGLMQCPACGLTYKTGRYFGSPAYAPELEAGIYGAAKGQLFSEALDFLDKALPGRGRLGEFLTAGLKVLYYWLAQALWFLTFGRVFAGSTLIATARKT